MQLLNLDRLIAFRLASPDLPSGLLVGVLTNFRPATVGGIDWTRISLAHTSSPYCGFACTFFNQAGARMNAFLSLMKGRGIAPPSAVPDVRDMLAEDDRQRTTVSSFAPLSRR